MAAGAPEPPWTRIETDAGVVLRRPIADDVPSLFAVHSDRAVYEFDPEETHRDPDHTARFLEPVLAHWTAHGFGYWSVLVPRAAWPDGVPAAGDADGDRVLAGLGGIRHHTVAGRPVLNVYYRFAPATQGRGLAGTVLRHAVAIGPLVAPGTDVVVLTRPSNAIARHVAERAGFIDEGRQPDATDMQLLRYRA